MGNFNPTDVHTVNKTKRTLSRLISDREMKHHGSNRGKAPIGKMYYNYLILHTCTYIIYALFSLLHINSQVYTYILIQTNTTQYGLYIPYVYMVV